MYFMPFQHSKITPSHILFIYGGVSYPYHYVYLVFSVFKIPLKRVYAVAISSDIILPTCQIVRQISTRHTVSLKVLCSVCWWLIDGPSDYLQTSPIVKLDSGLQKEPLHSASSIQLHPNQFCFNSVILAFI